LLTTSPKLLIKIPIIAREMAKRYVILEGLKSEWRLLIGRVGLRLRENYRSLYFSALTYLELEADSASDLILLLVISD
jgi:hypothetical protein